jgi:hypothetical protein
MRRLRGVIWRDYEPRAGQGPAPHQPSCGFFGVGSEILQKLVVYIGFGAQNFPFMQLFAALFGGLATCFGFRSLTLAVLLRNKANLGFLLVGSQ